MAREELTVQNAVKAGMLDLISVATAGNLTDSGSGGSFLNDGRTVLVCEIDAAGAQETITFTAITNQWGRTETLAPAVNVDKIAIIGPFAPRLWNQADGKIYFGLTNKDTDDRFVAVRIANPS